MAKKLEYEITATGCWVCVSHKPGTGGYITVTINKKRERLHRWAWAQAAQREIDWPCGIRHTCHNPPCFNPAHLLKGLEIQNASDSAIRGIRDGRSSKAMFSEEGVYDARKRYAEGESLDEIVKPLGSYYRYPAKMAILGQSYLWVPFPDENGNPVKRPRPHRNEELKDGLLAKYVIEESPFWRPDGAEGGRDWTPERGGFVRRVAA